MKLRTYCLLGLAALMTLTSAQAGTVEQALIIAEPQMQVKDGALEGCGMRLKSMPIDTAGLASTVVIDMSFNIYRSGMTLLKGGAVRIALREPSRGQASNAPIESFWMKAQSSRPTKPLHGHVMEAENPGYLLYGETLPEVSKLFNGLVDGTPLTLGVRLKGESIDRIYSGIPRLSDADRAQHAECLGGLVGQMKSDLEEKPSRP